MPESACKPISAVPPSPACAITLIESFLPKYLQIHVPCPLGWRHETNLTMQVAKLAVETGLYPLIEYENGVLTGKRQIIPKPVEEYLKLQGRFKHLLNNPDEIKKVQEIADNNIRKYCIKAETQVI